MTIKAAYRCDLEAARNNREKGVVKCNVDAGLGLCLPEKLPKKLDSFLEKYNIKAFTGIIHADTKKRRQISKRPKQATQLQAITDFKQDSIKALTRVVLAFSSIGSFDLKQAIGQQKIEVVFDNGRSTSGNSRRYGKQLQIVPGSQNRVGTNLKSKVGGMDNHGLLAHELAHYLMEANNSKIRRSYKDFMKNHRCSVSKYSTKYKGVRGTKEELAEVFAAYVLMPHSLTRSGPGCQKALEFMKNLFFEPKLVPTCEGRKASLASLNSR